MAKLTLVTINSGYYTTTQLNANFDDIETALENTLSRDGTSPNAMGFDLDMGGWNIVNCGNITQAATINATDTAQLGGYDAADYPRIDAAATISGAWNFTTSPTFPAGSVLFQNQEAVFTQPVQTTEVALTPGATVTPDCEDGNFFTLAADQSFTLENPANPPDAGKTMTILIRIVQDATGSRVITWGSKYKFQGGTATVLTTTANAVDLVSATYHAGSDTWMTQVGLDIS
jgi:hypothetical protein